MKRIEEPARQIPVMAETDVTPRQVDVARVQQALREQGVRLE